MCTACRLQAGGGGEGVVTNENDAVTNENDAVGFGGVVTITDNAAGFIAFNGCMLANIHTVHDRPCHVCNKPACVHIRGWNPSITA
jgi:hypothetical protein